MARYLDAQANACAALDRHVVAGCVGQHQDRPGALGAIWLVGVGGDVKAFELSESQTARRVKAIARTAGLSDWEFFSGHSGRVGMARRMAQNGAPTHEIERQGGRRHGRLLPRGEAAGSALRYL